MNKKQIKAAKKFTKKINKRCEKLAHEFGLATEVVISITTPESDTVIKCKTGVDIKREPSPLLRQLFYELNGKKMDT